MPTWRLLMTYWPDRELNLALEWALLKSVGSGASPSTIRLWLNGPCVVVGRSRRSLAEVRLEACEALGLPILRRPTAGGAVYHDEGNLNWTVVARRTDLLRNMWPDELEAIAASALLELLGSLDLEARLEARKGVFVGDRKVSGIAMYLGRDAVMVHGTLLVRSDLSALRAALRCKFEVANLSELTGSELDPWDLAPALARGLAEAFGANVVEEQLAPGERSLAEELRAEARACPEGK